MNSSLIDNISKGKIYYRKIRFKEGDTFNEVLNDLLKNPNIKIENEDLSPYQKRLKKSAAIIIFKTFDDRFRIPLCFSGYGITSKHIISDQVRSIDIFPTIMDVINSPNIRNIDGRSLFPYLVGEKMNELPALVESIPMSLSAYTMNYVGIRTSSPAPIPAACKQLCSVDVPEL